MRMYRQAQGMTQDQLAEKLGSLTHRSCSRPWYGNGAYRVSLPGVRSAVTAAST
jgi:transcriptional regulator with XRE-family HTH domain